MTTSPYTFEDLATPEGSDVIRARLIAALTADGQPVASWSPSTAGGVENLVADMVAGGLAFYMAQRIANVVTGRLLATATDTPENGYFLTYLGKRFYKLQKRAATLTIQNIHLTVAPTGSALDFGDGDLVVGSPITGNRYRTYFPNGGRALLEPGASGDAPFIAENPGASYLDTEGTITTMVTAKPGVTCANIAPFPFAPARQLGFSPGSVAGATALAAPAYRVVRARIDATGDIGSGAWSWSIDGGLTWTVAGVIPASYDHPAGGRLLFTNQGSPSFLAGSIFTLRVQDNFLQRGANAETDEAFRARCANRHVARALIPVKGHFELWAHEASPEVDKVWSDADPNTPGGILVTIASETGPATPQAQDAVEDFITAKLNGFKGVPAPASPTVAGSTSPQEVCQASSANTLVIAVGATVYVPVGKLAAAKAAVDRQWNAYLGSLPIGGLPGAVVEMQRFYTLMGELGAIDVQNLHINGVVSDIVIPKGVIAVPFPGLVLRNSLGWVAV